MTKPARSSEDVTALGKPKVNPGNVIHHESETESPALLMSIGRGATVMLGLAEFKAAQEDRIFMQEVVVGLLDLEQRREASLLVVQRMLGLV